MLAQIQKFADQSLRMAAAQAASSTQGSHQLIAGFTAGVSGVVVGHPMDTAKVWLQHGRTVRLRSLADVRALYSGTCVPLLTVGTVSAAVFFVNDCLLRWQTGDGGTAGAPSAAQRFWAGLGAGLAISPGTCVSVRLKTMLQTLDRRLPLTELAALLHRAEGPPGFFRGWRAHAAVESCGRAVYFLSYDAVKTACMRAAAAGGFVPHAVHERQGQGQGQGRGQRQGWVGQDAAATQSLRAGPEAPIGVRILAGGLAGGLGWLVVYPLDVVRAQMMSQCAAAPRTSMELAPFARRPRPRPHPHRRTLRERRHPPPPHPTLPTPDSTGPPSALPRLSASPRAPAPQATRRAELRVRAALRARDLRARRRGGLHARPAAHTRSRRACGGNRSARLRRGESAAAADPHGPVRADRRVNPVDHVSCACERAPGVHCVCGRNHILYIYVCAHIHVRLYIYGLSP